jgi:hypothetical protein
VPVDDLAGHELLQAVARTLADGVRAGAPSAGDTPAEPPAS